MAVHGGCISDANRSPPTLRSGNGSGMPLAWLLATVLLFALGTAAALYYLRTGRFWAGVLITALLWSSADLALLRRFVYGDLGGWFQVGIVGVLVTGGSATAWLVFQLWRRRYSAPARSRLALFRGGLVAYLRGDLATAAATFVRLVRCDPWDAAAWCALANVHARAGRPRRARWCRARAAAVDRGPYRAWLQQPLPLAAVRPGPAAPVVREAPPRTVAMRTGA